MQKLGWANHRVWGAPPEAPQKSNMLPTSSRLSAGAPHAGAAEGALERKYQLCKPDASTGSILRRQCVPRPRIPLSPRNARAGHERLGNRRGRHRKGAGAGAPCSVGWSRSPRGCCGAVRHTAGRQQPWSDRDHLRPPALALAVRLGGGRVRFDRGSLLAPAAASPSRGRGSARRAASAGDRGQQRCRPVPAGRAPLRRGLLVPPVPAGRARAGQPRFGRSFRRGRSPLRVLRQWLWPERSSSARGSGCSCCHPLAFVLAGALVACALFRRAPVLGKVIAGGVAASPRALPA